MPEAHQAASVTIIGGGIAGLTAALRLAERGFAVEIFEKGPRVGGNLSGFTLKGTYYDVYPHMFAQWYNNFWRLVEDVGLSRERDFERRDDFGALSPGEFPKYKVLTDFGALNTMIRNLYSGFLSVPEIFLASYTILDILVCGDTDSEFLENQTLNDFIVNKPYATSAVTRSLNEAVDNIWSIKSYSSSALAYQRFAKYHFREPSPSCWVNKGNSYKTLIEGIRNKLTELNCTIREHTEVTGVTVRDGRIQALSYVELEYNDDDVEIGRIHHPEPHAIDNMIVAASPAGLGDLVFARARHEPPAERGRSIVSLLPQLANVRRLGSEPLPVLYVAFRRRLPDIPSYYVALIGSKYALTFVKVAELSGPEKTVIAIAASDFDSIPIKFALNDARQRAGSEKTAFLLEQRKEAALHDAAQLILNEFQRYVPIDPDKDVDWENTFFQPNLDQQLFINQVGSQHWSTKVTYPEISNLYFAGTTGDNPITIATVESAVYSGLLAAQAVVGRHRGPANRRPIEIIPPAAYPTSLLLACKIMASPYAALAKLWVDADALCKDWIRGESSLSFCTGARAASKFGRSVETALAEWKRTAEAVCRLFMP